MFGDKIPNPWDVPDEEDKRVNDGGQVGFPDGNPNAGTPLDFNPTPNPPSPPPPQDLPKPPPLPDYFPTLPSSAQQTASTTTPPPAPAPLGDWQSVKNGDWNRAWTDFVQMQYGQAGRGAGFANMPSGGVQQAVNDFNAQTGGHAKFLGGASGDMVDFGNGPVDVRTAEGLLWNSGLGGNNGAGSGGSGGYPAPPPAPNGGSAAGGRNGTSGYPAPGQYGGPSGPGIYGDTNTQQVGEDPLSQLATSALAGLMLNGGRLTSETGENGYEALNNFLKKGGDTNARLESIREKMGLLQRAQMADARGQLADRGLLSEGSVAQGPEMSTLGRLNQHLAETYSGAARDALTEGDAGMLEAIKTATGLDEAASNRLLATVGATGDRQKMLSDIALKSLDQNIEWNKFLAQYGLDRDKTMYDIQNGQMGLILPLLNAFLGYLNGTSGGYV